MKFSFENLEVYQRSIEFNAAVESISGKKGVTRIIADQLSRAAISIPLNIAEGNGRWHKGDKKNFFWIARGSAFECIPLIEILTIKTIISQEDREALREKIEVIGKNANSSKSGTHDHKISFNPRYPKELRNTDNGS